MSEISAMSDGEEQAAWRAEMEAGHAACRAGRWPAAEVHFAAALKAATDGGLGDLLLAGTFANLAVTYQMQAKYAFAEDSLRRALAIKKRVLGEDHPDLAIEMHNLAVLYSARRSYDQAEPYYRSALSLRARHKGIDSDEYQSTRAQYAKMLRAAGRGDEAALLEAGEQMPGPGLPA